MTKDSLPPGRPSQTDLVRAVPLISTGTWLILVIVLLAMAVLSAALLRRDTLFRQAQDLAKANQQLAEQVDRSHGGLLGALITQGLIHPLVKDVLVSGERPHPRSALYQDFGAVIRHFKLDNMQVVDEHGVTVAYVDDEGSHHGVGTDRSARPFVARTLAGLTSRDPVMGRSSGVRGIYLAAPVRADVSEDSRVLGSVVVRTGLEDVDRLLQAQGDPVMLLSPDGLVYATNRKEWLFKLAEPLSGEQEVALRKSQQFGKLFAKGRPESLPASLTPGAGSIGGRRYIVSEEKLDWDNEGRGWRLLLLRERTYANEWAPAVRLAAGILLAGAFGMFVWRRRERWRLANERMRTARDGELRAVTEASHARLLRMSESLPCAVFQFLHPPARQGEPGFLFVGHPAREVLGLSSDELLADWRCHLRQVHPQDKRALIRVLLKAARNGQPLSIDYRVIQAGGERWIRMSARHADELQGAVWTGYWLDVSQEVAHHEDLKLREQQLLNLLESAPGAVIVTDVDGEVLFHNQRAYALYGLSTENDHALYVHPETRAALILALQRDGHAHADAEPMRRGDGSTFWASITLSQGTFDSRRDAVFGWSADITERKRAEDALLQAKEAAEAAVAARSAFLANMSHEIRTPMNAIIGLAHLTLGSGLSAQQREYVEKIHRSALGLLGIINDILDFSKIEAGKLTLEQADFEFDDVLNQLVTLNGERAAEKGLELVFEVDRAVPRQLRSDALRLGQVLINLLSNAVKFTASGEVVLTCRMAQGMQDGAMALDLTVSDTGIGMTAEQAGRIFAPFSQADESMTRRFGGTGLGLSICKRLVDVAGGVLELESAVGRGSRFHFTWPVAPAATPRPFPALPAAYQGARVLLVTSHERTSTALAQLIGQIGLATDRAASVQQAMAMFSQDGHQIILCDQDLPDGPGLALLRQLASPDRQPLARILLTSHATEILRESAWGAGVTLLPRPVTRSALREALGIDAVDERPASVRGLATALRGLRVLLVEDNEINQMVAGGLLEEIGVDMDVAENGRIALELLAAAEGAYDLILMDMQMPEMDGYEATRHIRANPQWDALPIIAMTAHAMAEHQQSCLDAGMNDYLSKPIDPVMLFQVLARWGKRPLQ